MLWCRIYWSLSYLHLRWIDECMHSRTIQSNYPWNQLSKWTSRMLCSLQYAIWPIPTRCLCRVIRLIGMPQRGLWDCLWHLWLRHSQQISLHGWWIQSWSNHLHKRRYWLHCVEMLPCPWRFHGKPKCLRWVSCWNNWVRIQWRWCWWWYEMLRSHVQPNR